MHPTPKFSVCLAAIGVSCAGLLLVFCNSVWPEEAKKANPRVKELQEKRLAVLETIHDVARQNFANARVSFEEVHTAQAALLAARLDYAETQKDRIKACDEAVQEALGWQEATKAMVEANRASRVVELKAQAYLLETQIMREKAEAGG